MSPLSSGSGHETNATSGPSHRVACTNCRSLKIRCNGVSDTSTSCERCVRLGKTCEFAVQKRRGRKAGRGAVPSAISSSSSTIINGHMRAASERGVRPPSSTPTPAERSVFVRDTGTVRSELRRDASTSRAEAAEGHGRGDDLTALAALTAATPSAIASVPSVHVSLATHASTEEGRSPRHQSVLEVAAYLNPPSPTHILDLTQRPTASGPSTSSRHNDVDRAAAEECPVALGLFSAIEAQHLLHLYMNFLNPMICLLDRHLHTLAFIRETSPVLLSAILTCVTKYFRQENYQALFAHTQTLITRAFLSGACNTGLTQALMLLVYFKSPTDRTAWSKLGLAIRMGYQMRWHIPRATPLPEDDHEARMILNHERAWMFFDRIYARLFDLPKAIQSKDLVNGISWAREHSQLCLHIDVSLACSHDLLPIYDITDLLLKNPHLPKDYCSNLLAEFEDRHEQLLNRWFSSNGHFVPEPGFSKEAFQYMHWTALGPLFAVRCRALEIATETCASESEVGAAVEACLSVSSLIVAQAEIMSKNGMLRFLQDVSIWQLSSLAQFLPQLLYRVGKERRVYVGSLLRRIHRCCEETSSGDSQAPTDFVARLLHRLMRRVATESRMPSRSQSEEPSGPTETPNFDAFFGTQPVPVDSFTMDDTFWNALFPMTEDNPQIPDTFDFTSSSGFATLPSEQTVNDETIWSSLFPGTSFTTPIMQPQR